MLTAKKQMLSSLNVRGGASTEQKFLNSDQPLVNFEDDLPQAEPI
jgi:hypothetical protein